MNRIVLKSNDIMPNKNVYDGCGMASIRPLKAAAGHIAQYLLSTTRRVCTHVGKKRGYFRKRKTSSSQNTKKCPDVHIQPDIPGTVIDEHPMNPCSNTSTAQAQSFPLFPLLPPELRLQIWHFASTAERVVELQALNRVDGFCTGAAPLPPAVLHACYESRNVARRIYRRWFWTSMESKKPIHINPVDDIVFLRNGQGIATRVGWDWVVGPRSIWQRQLRRLQRVAFWCDNNPMDLKGVGERYCIRMTGQFRDLRELILLWVLDGSTRPIHGRGANVFSNERGSLCHDCSCSKEARNAAEQSRERILSRWRANGIWERLGREPPAINIMHWCTRSGEVL
jgi:hypothetical protein